MFGIREGVVVDCWKGWIHFPAHSSLFVPVTSEWGSAGNWQGAVQILEVLLPGLPPPS